MAKRQIDSSLYCTPERVRHSREMIIEPRETESAGNVVMTGQRELQECALDILLRNDRLGRKGSDEARWRFNAGMWLRELYLKTHPSEGVGAYSIRLESSGEMTEEMAWNLKAYQDTATDLKRHWRILEQVCCEDHAQGNPTPIWNALDALYELREGFIEDYLASFEKALEVE
jgi:hypothetical protein